MLEHLALKMSRSTWLVQFGGTQYEPEASDVPALTSAPVLQCARYLAPTCGGFHPAHAHGFPLFCGLFGA